MIISHKHKFIFLKTGKTAGTSIEIALSEFCGDEDIITPITTEDEEIRRHLGYRGPQNYLAPISDYGFRDFKALLLKRKRKRRFHNHISAKEVKKRIENNIWNSYFKFCFERNPWDCVVSQYFFKRKSKPGLTLSEFLDAGMQKSSKKIYTIDGSIVVDRVCMYEDLQEELEKIRVRLGIPEKLTLPRAKSRFRKDRRNYREVLNETQREKIREFFSEEISLLGYEF